LRVTRIMHDEDENLIRMPAGFKRDVWQFELIGSTQLFAFSVAETARELKNA
jgi:hypothetical protein